MQRKKLATKIASILLSAAMLVSTAMTAFATDGEVSVAAEQTEVQTVAEVADDEALEASEEDATASEELTEGETAVEEEITADEVITEESTTEAAQENVEETQVLDADEVASEENEIAVAEENISTVDNTKTTVSGTSIQYSYDSGTLSFTGSGELPDYTKTNQAPWYETAKKYTVTKIVIGEGITKIGNYNFYNGHDEATDRVYNNLTTVTFPSTLTTIGEGAFQGTGITEVSLTGNAEIEIGESAFMDCTSLTKFFVPNRTVTLDGGYNFSNCPKLTEVTCKEMKTIPTRAFYNCSSLSSTINGVTTIGSKAFYNCSALTGLGSAMVTYMGEAALEGSGITGVRFQETNLELAEKAFSGAGKLTQICYRGTRADWKKISKDAGVSLTVSVHCVGSENIDQNQPSPSVEDQYARCDFCNGWYKKPDPDQDPEPETETETETETEVGHQHSWSAWKTKSPATVFKAEVQERTCSKCGKTDTRTVGKKLTPTITVNAKKIWLQKGQKTSAFKVSGLANGDSVKSYKSSNKKIFTVTNKGVIKAGKKVGKAKLTITLASGKKKVVTVQVQKRQVKTWAIKNLPTKVTVKKGATYTLSPVVSLITSTHKVTYKSSNKKVATVTKAGKIKGVKKGTATIKVKSGTVTKKVKVTVK